MPPPRSNRRTQRRRETASGTGCLSHFLIPPLAALVVGLAMMLTLTSLRPEDNLPAHAAAIPTSEAGVAPTAGLSPTGLSPIFTPQVQAWGTQIVSWAAEYGLDPNMVATVMQIESCGNPRARSSAGAMGLFQVMPFHFEKTENPYAPQTNAMRGLSYLQRSLAAAGGNTSLAFAGYNGGIGVISRPQSQWAEETRRYVYWASGIYADAISGVTSSARMEEWKVRAGGVCK